jgi:hypothetical protein
MTANLLLSDGASPCTPLVSLPAKPTWRQQLLTVLTLVALYGLGLAGWAWFFHGGALDWTSYDWPKEFAYYQVIREALLNGEVPYHISEYFNGTNRFLGMPETNLSPQVLLLRWFDVSHFILFDLLLMYSLGFLGCLLIRRRYRLGLASFTLLVLLFLCNGYVQSRMAVGHSMWAGYFLLPFFGLLVLRWQEEGPSLPVALKLALVLFAMMLHGSFHMVNWCWLFLALMIAFNPRQWKYGLVVLLTGGLLSLFRLLPGYVAFRDVEPYRFIGGYQSVGHLIESLTVLHTHLWKLSGGEHVEAGLGWWEYDLYVGPIGFAALVFLGIGLRFSRRPELAPYRYPGLDAPMIVLTLLAIGFLHGLIAVLPLPMASVERITSRFVTIPFVILLMISVIRLERLLQTVTWTPTLLVVIVCGLVETATTLGYHGHLWRISLLEKEMHLAEYHAKVPECYSAVIIKQSEPFYVASVQVSAVVSLLTLVVVLVLLWRTRRTPATV